MKTPVEPDTPGPSDVSRTGVNGPALSDVSFTGVEGPSLRALARTTVVAVVVAGFLLMAFVLPAEYGIDPLGTGRRLGLTAIASPPLAPVDDLRPGDAPLTPIQNGPMGQYPAAFKFDVVDLVLEPFEYLEYKYRLEEGASMFYSWTASAPLTHDFHGERTTPPTDGSPAEQSYDKQDRQHAHGSFVAPFTGIHGWFWENPGNERITIRLTSSGFYASGIEMRMDHTTKVHELRSIEALTPTARVAGSSAGAQAR